MADINKTIAEIEGTRKTLLKELEVFLSKYHAASMEVNSRFKDEYNRSPSMNGLEDFAALNHNMRRNAACVKAAHEMLRRVKDVSGYAITEEDEPEESLEKILK